MPGIQRDASPKAAVGQLAQFSAWQVGQGRGTAATHIDFVLLYDSNEDSSLEGQSCVRAGHCGTRSEGLAGRWYEPVGEW